MSNIKMFRTTERLVMGAGAINNIVQEIAALGGSKPMIVTDPGLVATGIIERLEELLSEGGLQCARFDKVEADPRYELVNEVVQLVQAEGVDCIIGIGGGSSLDIAKIVAVMVNNPGSVAEYFGIDLVKKPGLPMVLIPTTAGTGSEVTPIVILSDHQEKLKKGVVSSHLFPDCALLDAELTVGLPPAVTAATGMDALIHAMEAYTSINANSTTDMLAVKAMELIFDNIRTAYANGQDIEAREKMLEGSMLAGMAFANAGVTAVHAFAYPIGAEFHIPHGIANTIMLTPVMEFNLIGNIEKFAEIAKIFGEGEKGMSQRKLAELGVAAVKQLADDLNVPQNLTAYGVKDEDIPGLAEGVMKVTRLLANNPRTLQQEDAENIYRRVL
ncbi:MULTISPECIES: iron-containing alcohol dehydrogenase [Desulfosediminicola]|uniref:iron-containing alcohol dehydrogenase n=1 Tax=Desulfosediminicola TaxID=2886823 RepID=UPI0010ACA56A|nr:iron-containing alcohol dehydrogenase [Desulfosediminicola ganghwensis]